DAFESALEKCPRTDHRHGIVHCQVSRVDQLERISRLGLHVYAQSIFLDYDNHIVEKVLDPSLVKTSYNWKTLMDLGVSVSNGSDCPVELPDAMRGIECAVTRTSLDGTGPYLPEQAFTVNEAIDSFTSRSAEASFEENEKGLIKKGYLADFVILGSDPFKSVHRSLHSIPVISTYLAGKQVYGKELCPNE
ncbi:MAG: amidohydrolase family protein, partial [Clostridia bacterium]|nr:amidohydrolase family protein [Clostridia bacterium]